MGLLSQDWDTLTMVLVGALAGGFVNGLTGFGTGLTALPFWLQAVDLARNFGFSAKELRRLQKLVIQHQTAFLEAWHGHFGADG